MKNITDVDSNFKIKTSIQQEGIRFFDPHTPPFSIHGVTYENERYRRMPHAVASSVNDSIEYLHSNTAGGRVRFKTDSPYVAISAKLDNLCKMASFAMTGSASFDIYAKGENLPRVLNGLGIAIISTSEGMMTDRQARKKNVGGEVIAYVW